MGAKILSKTYLNSTKTTYEMVVKAPLIAQKAHAGNFVILHLDEQGERFPITIADYDREAGTITIVVAAIGKSTSHLSRFEPGDEIPDFIGPLGQKIHIKKYNHPVVLVGGGVGIAAIYPQAKELKTVGNQLICVLGARTQELLFWEEKFHALTDQVHIVTDDGSSGRKGVVTDPLRDIIKSQEVSLVIAIGPLIMMKFVAKLTNGEADLPKVKTMVSLNPIMVDGTGMCGGCRFNTLSGETKFACVDGPDVDGHNVDFENLLRRNNRYRNIEQIRMEQYEHQCQAEQKFNQE
jgi:ferredoxin--NADP+ reductase